MHLQSDKIWISKLVTYQMVIHHFGHILYVKEKKGVGKLKGQKKKRKMGKTEEKKKR